MEFSAILAAAGAGERAGPGGAKQWRPLAGKAVARWSLEALLAAGAREVIVVIAPGAEDQAAEAFAGLSGWRTVRGGATRAESTRAGLAALTGPDDTIVLIHDAARPFLERRHVEGVVAAVRAGTDGALPALALADTLKRRDAAGAVATASREALWRAQTPQAFRLDRLQSAWAAWPTGEAPTDDAAVVERDGGTIVLTAGDPRLIKLTYPEDFAMAEALAGMQGRATRRTRIGQGLDAHRFGPGDHLWLCGVRLEHDRTLVGHSDADAALHALTDALLGAIGEGDIGDHFPPSDPRWRGAASEVFLRHAAGLIAARGGAIANIDLTIVCERPRIGPHRAAMRVRLAEILGIEAERISVKATTTETMGFAGREEGLVAMAVASVEIGE